MANKFLKSVIGVAILAGSFTANASGISGDISFGGGFWTPANGSFQATSLASATSIDYNGNHIEDSAFAFVGGATGDFAADGIGAGDSATLYDFVFNPLAALGADLWTVAGTFDTYTFTVTSVTINNQSPTTLSLSGNGYVSYGDNDQTMGTWNFTGNPNGNGTTFSFSTGASVTPVPEPEIYAMMAAGLGLMGFVARRRQRNGAVA